LVALGSDAALVIRSAPPQSSARNLMVAVPLEQLQLLESQDMALDS
jgi:hypothetical protein